MCYTFIYKDQNNKIKIQSIPDNSNNFIHLLNKNNHHTLTCVYHLTPNLIKLQNN